MTEIRTPRLRLVRGTPAHLRAELESPAALAAAMGVAVAASWPPELYDEDAVRWTLAWLEANPDDTRYGFYYIVETDPATTEPSLVVGIGGYKGTPDETGTIEIGYGVVPERRRRGYAREAVEGWVAHAFEDPRVRRVVAHTLADLEPSIGVLRVTGFRFVGQGDDPSEPSAVQYELTRDMYDRARTRRLLEAERANLLDLVTSVPDELRGRQPAPGRWSIVEVLQHLAHVEAGVTRLLIARGRERPAEPTDTTGALLTPERIAWVRDRGERREAPERIRPTGGVSFAEALAKLADARAAFLAAFDAADAEALDMQTYVHQNIGRLTLRSWVEFVAHHEARHAEQIAEIASELAAIGSTSS